MVSGIRYSGSPAAPARLVNASLHIRSLKDIPVFRIQYFDLRTKIEKTLRKCFTFETKFCEASEVTALKASVHFGCNLVFLKNITLIVDLLTWFVAFSDTKNSSKEVININHEIR